MERKFYNDNLERLLKENADQFKMYPSRKVWHGLYNDLHPGTRWPSITISIIFIFSFVIIGHLNTSNNHGRNGGTNLVAPATGFSKREPNGHKNISYAMAAKNPSERQDDILTENKVSESSIPTEVTAPENGQKVIPAVTDIAGKENVSDAGNTTGFREAAKQYSQGNANDNMGEKNNDALNSGVDNNAIHIISDQSATAISDQDPKTADNSTVINTLTGVDKQVDKKPLGSSPLTTSSSVQPRIRKHNLTWEYYITPSVSYRSINTNGTSEIIQTNATTYAISPTPNSAMQHPYIGGEAGASVKYNLSKKLRFLTGIQLNYSQFNTVANFTHPTMATLYLNNESTGLPYSVTAISFYGNGTSTGPFTESILHNYSFQASLPIGLDYRVGGNDKIDFNVAASFQPSFVFSSQSYLLSTDKRNFLTDPDLLRKWNMNTSFSPYLSIKSSKFSWQIGPQVRYQILSTYNIDYPAKEHLLDYGLRFGISKGGK